MLCQGVSFTHDPNMKHIRFISTTTIQPTRSNAHDHHPDDHNQFTPRIELTPWDIRCLKIGYIQKGLLFPKPKQTSDTALALIEHLKATLTRTLDIFYPLAGRLAVIENDDRTSSFYLRCNGLGAQFVHATAQGIALADVVKPSIVPDDLIFSLFQMNEVQDYQGITQPLLSVQVTELLDGVFIGCSMNHSVVDGSSFWRFFNTWSQISRGDDQVLQPAPVFDRQFLDGIVYLPIRIPFTYNEISATKEIRFSMPLLQRRVFHFSKEKIAKLKARANSEMGTTNISSLQALMAHLWLSITRNRHFDPDEKVFYRIVMGMRQRIQPRLPEEFLGNAALGGFVESTAGELLKNGLGWAALEMNKMIASWTPGRVSKFLEDWAKCPVMLNFGEATVGNTKLFTGSSPRFDVYGNDFGWGRPIGVWSGPENLFEGKLTVFQGAEKGSIDFEACLPAETLQAMADDEEFMLGQFGCA